jgi:hypothetical protein
MIANIPSTVGIYPVVLVGSAANVVVIGLVVVTPVAATVTTDAHEPEDIGDVPSVAVPLPLPPPLPLPVTSSTSHTMLLGLYIVANCPVVSENVVAPAVTPAPFTMLNTEPVCRLNTALPTPMLRSLITKFPIPEEFASGTVITQDVPEFTSKTAARSRVAVPVSARTVYGHEVSGAPPFP